jgi:hypothetical protein
MVDRNIHGAMAQQLRPLAFLRREHIRLLLRIKMAVQMLRCNPLMC